MSDPLIRRFARIQIVFHWLVAVPYVTLMISGVLLAIQHLSLVPWMSHALTAGVHRWAGAILVIAVVQMAVVALIGGRSFPLLGDFLSWVLIGARDLRWLLTLPLHLVFPRRFFLPPADRFNAGQKLHGLFVSAATAIFAITGGFMFWHPADLRPWMVHISCAIAAVGFLVTHLFLGLINPSTRRALRGILTGFVSRAYVEDHHTLTIEPAAQPRPHALVSWRAVFATVLVALALVGGLIHLHGWQRFTRLASRFSQGAETMMLLPGPLAAVHTDGPTPPKCKACHQSLGEPSNTACVTCHPIIAEVMRQGIGYHGQLQGRCAACHPDHRGHEADILDLDPRTFNHGLARFTLQGRHNETACDQCHFRPAKEGERPRFVQLRFSQCADCHPNPHWDLPADKCACCHSERGWKGSELLFDHQRDSIFKIDVLHSALSCAACHVPTTTGPVYRPLPTDCEGCHIEPADAMAGKIGDAAEPADPHYGRVGCVDCHDPQSRSLNPLVLASACTKCHNPHYQDLAFNWQRSLDDRATRVREMVHKLNEQNPAAARALEEQLTRARRVGLHNVQAAARILDNLGPTQGRE